MKCCVYVIILYFASRNFILHRLDFHQFIIPIIVNNSIGSILDSNTSENGSKMNTTGTKNSKHIGRGKIINHVICSISCQSIELYHYSWYINNLLFRLNCKKLMRRSTNHDSYNLHKRHNKHEICYASWALE